MVSINVVVRSRSVPLLRRRLVPHAPARVPSARNFGFKTGVSLFPTRQQAAVATCFCLSAIRIPKCFAEGSLVRDSYDDNSDPNVAVLHNNSVDIMTGLEFSINDQDRKYFSGFIRWLRGWLRTLLDSVALSLRTAQLGFHMAPLIVLTPISMISSSMGNQTVSDVTWWYTLHAVQAMGPAFVKLCQWISTRRDLFPNDICERLSRLQDHAIPHSWSDTHRILTEAFGPSYAEQGLEVNPSSIIGCGSAAQVYQATLTVTTTTNTDGSLVQDKEKQQKQTTITRPVAVKVLHPQFSEMVERDLWFMETIAKLLHSMPFDYFKMLNLPRATENFAAILRRQADLEVEANNLDQFRKNFYGPDDDEDTSAIIFPRPIEGWISPNAMVEDFHDADPISDFIGDTSQYGPQIKRDLAGPLLRAFLKMIFLDNFVHCDLHPGNVLVKTEKLRKLHNVDGKSVELEGNTVVRGIVFLDAGIATSLSPNDQRNLIDLFRAVILNDGATAARLMVERAKYERCSQTEGGVEAFAAGVDEIVKEFHDRRKQGLTLGAVRIGSLLSRVLNLCRIHGVEIDPSMASIVISTLVLEGLGRSLEPDLNLMDFALPFILGRGKV